MGYEPDRSTARPFGADSRERLLVRYFSSVGSVDASTGWKHIYRLLLWIDRTTGLAHCYESDKAQPGRPWYARSLAFHDWLAQQFDVLPADLGDNIDWLFREATGEMLEALLELRAQRMVVAERQREPYAGRELPEPGEDPELEEIIRDALGSYFTENPPREVMRSLSERIQLYLAQENKRKNLVGEGFEDVLAFIIDRVANKGMNPKPWDVVTRSVLHHVPGFHEPRPNEKPRKVDLAIVRAGSEADTLRRRVLATVKWSIRADREEQFGVDFADYARLESWGRDFDYVLFTNEFDPARVVAACERRRENSALFNSVIHVNPQSLLAAYEHRPSKSARSAIRYIEEGRVIGLEIWLKGLDT